MTKQTIVEWGGSTGFALSVRPGVPRPPMPFIAAAENLVRYPAVQPPERIGSPAQFPIWCLVHVEIEDAGPHWCFAVQGRDGAFGRAGSCQFLFAKAEQDPLFTWLRGIEMIGPDGRLCYEKQREIPFDMPRPGRLADSLGALLADEHRVPIAGDPLEVAADITALLCVLPLAVIRSRVWATFLLKRPVLEDKAVVSGHWPAELANNSSARGVREWLGEVSVVGERHGREREALEWIALQAADAHILHDYRDQPSMMSFVDAVIRDELGIRVQDIPRLLESNPDALRTSKATPIVIEWARTNPDGAIAALVPPRLMSDLADNVFDGLLRAHSQADQGNPARFPPAGEGSHPGWHDVLAAALKHRLRTRNERIAFVRDTLLAPGRPLAAPGAVERAASWLTKIGVSPNDETITIFPVSVDAIAAALKRPYGTLGARQQAFLRDAEDPRVSARQILGRLRYVNPRAADQLLEAMPGPEQRVWLLDELVNQWRTNDAPVPLQDWVAELTALRRKDRAVIVEGLYGYLSDLGELTDELLDAALREYAARPESSATQRKLLTEAGARIASRRAVVPSVLAGTADFEPTAESTVDYYGYQPPAVESAGPLPWTDPGSEYRPPVAAQPEYAEEDQPPPVGLLVAQTLVVVVVIVFLIISLVAKQG